ncbi:MAG: epoxyqueuosine reductase QueH [Lachnospiraceae bacterium]|nr:epoxyqueuosine reductase QueH [Lachnospiraceae bacterium]
MNDRNYQKELESLIGVSDNRGKRLLLHSCCAPCSSYVLTYLSSFFDITVFYYNPNITDQKEYLHRVAEQKRLIENLNSDGFVPEWSAVDAERIPIKFIEGEHDTDSFYEAAKGLEGAPEGGSRCERCFYLRLKKTGELALREGFDFFTTTLTISPLKNAKLINSVGEAVAAKLNERAADVMRPDDKIDDNALMWMPSDFKKKGGYARSIELSAKYDLYRQNYCGCEFSMR